MRWVFQFKMDGYGIRLATMSGSACMDSWLNQPWVAMQKYGQRHRAIA